MNVDCRVLELILHHHVSNLTKYKKEINEEVMKNKEISWDKIKEIKTTKPKKSTLHVFDTIHFYRFFKDRYRDS